MFRYIGWGIALAAGLLSTDTAVSAAAYTTTDHLVYASPGGRSLRLTLYQPGEKAETLRPAILLIHGGGWRVGTRYQCMWYAHRFAEHGYVAVTINYRMMNKYPFPNCLYDAKSAVRWLRLHASEYHIDPNRIAALGESAGGHLATLLGTTADKPQFDGSENLGASSKVQAVISVYGATDLTYFKKPEGMLSLWGFTSKFMGRFVDVKNEKSGEDAFAAASPITYVSKTTAPTLFIHGTDDHMVPFAQSQTFHDKLKSLGVPTKLIAVPGRDHGFDHFHPSERGQLFKEMLSFLEKHMGAGGHG